VRKKSSPSPRKDVLPLTKSDEKEEDKPEKAELSKKEESKAKADKSDDEPSSPSMPKLKPKVQLDDGSDVDRKSETAAGKKEDKSTKKTNGGRRRL
jgi:hypothetical protein